MTNPKLPGMPGPGAKKMEQREDLIAAVVELHRKITPLLELLDERCALQMSFKVSGDKLTVKVVPGKQG